MVRVMKPAGPLFVDCFDPCFLLCRLHLSCWHLIQGSSTVYRAGVCRAALSTSFLCTPLPPSGGGATLLHLSELVPGFRDTLEDMEEKLGADIVMKALRAPCRIIANNAGKAASHSHQQGLITLLKQDSLAGLSWLQHFEYCGTVMALMAFIPLNAPTFS